MLPLCSDDDDDAPFSSGGDPGLWWWSLSGLDRGGKVSPTGGGDLSLVYGGEEGSGGSDATEVMSEEAAFGCVFSCRSSGLSNAGLIGEARYKSPPPFFFRLWPL